MSSFSPGSTSLNAVRDRVADELRALRARFEREFPQDLDSRGILERADDLLEQQLDRVERLAEQDLERPGEEPEEVLQVLLGAQHLPRMVLAMGQVLEQEQERPAPTPLMEAARQAAAHLQLLMVLWLRSQGWSGAADFLP